jgi:hypothetical protein
MRVRLLLSSGGVPVEHAGHGQCGASQRAERISALTQVRFCQLGALANPGEPLPSCQPKLRLRHEPNQPQTSGLWLCREGRAFLPATYMPRWDRSTRNVDGVKGDQVIHAILDLMYAKAPYTVMQRAEHIHKR